jgi:hypothetical protein
MTAKMKSVTKSAARKSAPDAAVSYPAILVKKTVNFAVYDEFDETTGEVRDRKDPNRTTCAPVYIALSQFKGEPPKMRTVTLA